MKIKLAVLSVFIIIISCKNKPENLKVKTSTYQSFGMKINDADALPAARMAVHYKNMSVGDSINSKMTAIVDDVCKAKGCWMKLNLEDGNQVMVKFKNYAFFVPKDIEGKEVVGSGLNPLKFIY